MIRPKCMSGRRLRQFHRAEEGSATLEFLMLFTTIWLFFMISIEAGTLSLRHVMLERGLDLTVREVRLGLLPDPDHNDLVQRTCEYAPLLPNCLNSLRLEMITADPRAWSAPSANVPCINRAEQGSTEVDVTNGENNQLMVLRVCALFKPMMPLSGLGRELANSGRGDEYALIATSSYVMEPFK